MKHLIAPRITLDTDPAPRDVSALMDKAGVQTNVIGTINWAAFPYRPAVKFRIAHTGSTILLHYTVGERMTRAVYGDDLGQVWTDSCVEFFSSPADDGCYYNLETNCIGTVLLCRGTSREGREPAPAEALTAIGRYSTLGRKPFAEHHIDEWQLSLVIPAKALWFGHTIDTLDGLVIGANFYKCGDKLPEPHFVSWNAIDVPQPDFHRPDHFGRVTFGK